MISSCVKSVTTKALQNPRLKLEASMMITKVQASFRVLVDKGLHLISDT